MTHRVSAMCSNMADVSGMLHIAMSRHTKAQQVATIACQNVAIKVTAA